MHRKSEVANDFPFLFVYGCKRSPDLSSCTAIFTDNGKGLVGHLMGGPKGIAVVDGILY